MLDLPKIDEEILADVAEWTRWVIPAIEKLAVCDVT